MRPQDDLGDRVLRARRAAERLRISVAFGRTSNERENMKRAVALEQAEADLVLAESALRAAVQA